MAGLRERKKAEAMRRIQAAAVQLFRERGFDAVTVEEVADAAETSPSSIYRYFGTKEGLVLHDEYDAVVIETFTELIRSGTPVVEASLRALAMIGDEHFRDDREPTMFRMELWLTHKGVQAAAGTYLLDVCESLARLVAEAEGYDLVEARFISNALVNGFISAVQSWYEDGADRPAEEYIMRGMGGLVRALGEGAGASPSRTELRRPF